MLSISLKIVESERDKVAYKRSPSGLKDSCLVPRINRLNPNLFLKALDAVANRTLGQVQFICSELKTHVFCCDVEGMHIAKQQLFGIHIGL